MRRKWAARAATSPHRCRNGNSRTCPTFRRQSNSRREVAGGHNPVEIDTGGGNQSDIRRARCGVRARPRPPWLCSARPIVDLAILWGALQPHPGTRSRVVLIPTTPRIRRGRQRPGRRCVTRESPVSGTPMAAKAVQSTCTNGPVRPLRRWRCRAIAPFPVPLSPRTITGISLGAIRVEQLCQALRSRVGEYQSSRLYARLRVGIRGVSVALPHDFCDRVRRRAAILFDGPRSRRRGRRMHVPQAYASHPECFRSFRVRARGTPSYQSK